MNVASKSFRERAFFGVFAIALAFVLWHNERFLLNPHAPEWAHYHPMRRPLLPHGVAGAFALCLGALQFSTTLRRQHPRVHRMFGKVYIVATLVLAPAAVCMAVLASPWFLLVFTVVQALTVVLFTLVAYACVRRRNFAAHREWMVRSYSVLLIFLEGRILMAIPALARRGLDAVVMVNWACLAVSLVAVEVFLRWREILPRDRRAVSGVRTTTKAAT